MSKAQNCWECPQFERGDRCGLYEKLTSADSGCVNPTHADSLKAREVTDIIQWEVSGLLAWRRKAEEYLSRVS